MDNYKQLYEKANEEYKKFYPLTDILSIIDKESGKNLKQLLNQYNHIKLDWKGNTVDTRNSVPLILRHKGLFVTYDTGSNIVTEYYTGDDISASLNVIWQNDNNWTNFSVAAGLADQEDITEVNGKFKFADRNHNAAQFTGMGRVILRKNFVDVGGGTVKNVLTQGMINKPNTIYEIRYDFDLNGQEITIPEGCVLDFQGGSFSNGSIVGNGTGINSYESRIFTNVDIKGIWSVQSIYSTWFDCSDVNSISNVFKLSNDSVYNIIQIREGVYNVRIGELYGISINLTSNTKLILDGIISLEGNDLTNYSIIAINGKNNIEITGGGSILGDVETHYGEGGEWGFGIEIKDSKNVEVKGLTINKCWGDSIYIGGDSNDIRIENVSMSGSRRQGISITNGYNIEILNCNITDIYGTDPGAAIDLEPNENNFVHDVKIENLRTNNCNLSFECYGYYNKVYNIYITNCVFNNPIGTKMNIYLYDVRNVVFDKCIFEDNISNGNYILQGNKCSDIKVTDSTFIGKDITAFDFENSENVLLSGCRIKTEGSLAGLLLNTKVINCNIETNNLYYLAAGRLNPIYMYGNNIVMNSDIDLYYDGEVYFENNNITIPLFKLHLYKDSRILFNTFNVDKFYVASRGDKNVELKGNIINSIDVSEITVATGFVNAIDNHFKTGVTLSNSKEAAFKGNTVNSYFNVNGARAKVSDNIVDVDNITFILSNSDIFDNYIYIRNAEVYNQFKFNNCGFYNNYVVTIAGSVNFTLHKDTSINNIFSNKFIYEGENELLSVVVIESVGTSFKNNYVKGNSNVDYGIRVRGENNILRHNRFVLENMANEYYIDESVLRCLITKDIEKYSNSASLPTLGVLDKGVMVFDTSIQKPIWWTGTKWVDATGADV